MNMEQRKLPKSVIAQLGLEQPCKRIEQTSIVSWLNMPNALPIASSEASVRQEKRLVVFTDGACSNNGNARARAGYGVVWPHDRSLDVSKRLPGSEQTNNRAEFMALIEAQSMADVLDPTHQSTLYVYTDSELLINSITKWLSRWKRQQWKKSDGKQVLNRDLLEKIDSNPRPLVFQHVRAHTGQKNWESINNDEADRLARNAITL